MSNAFSKETVTSQSSVDKKSSIVPWNPWLGALFTVLLFLTAQFAASILILLVPELAGWSKAEGEQWLNNSLTSRIIFLVLTATFILLPLHYYLKRHKVGFKIIGLRKPQWIDLGWSLAALPVYIVTFAVSVAVIKFFVPGLDVNQAQDLGFNASYNPAQLFFIAIALVVLPPITEEIIFRGMLYGSLKKGMPILFAALITSLLFASGHLLQGSGGGLLYIAGIDTFILSLILIGLREASGGLWASIGLHAIKNGIAFVSLFILHAR